MTRPHDAHFTAIHVAQQTRKEARAADHAYLTTPATRWQTGGNVSFDVPVVQPSTSGGPSYQTGGAVDAPVIGRKAIVPASVVNETPRVRSEPLTHQRPGPVDCRADTPFPCGSSVAAVGAPLYALVHYCRAAGLPEPVPEYRFHPTRMWRFDYAFPLHKIAVEVDGGVWTQGRHTRGAGYIADMEKMNAAAKLGWRVLKYTPQTLGVAIDDLRLVLA